MILSDDTLFILLSLFLSTCGFVLGFLVAGTRVKEKVVTKTVIIDKGLGAQKKGIVGSIKRPSAKDYERLKNPKLAETEDAMTKTFEDLGL